LVTVTITWNRVTGDFLTESLQFYLPSLDCSRFC
jgi:hypothetical protein